MKDINKSSDFIKNRPNSANSAPQRGIIKQRSKYREPFVDSGKANFNNSENGADVFAIKEEGLEVNTFFFKKSYYSYYNFVKSI